MMSSIDPPPCQRRSWLVSLWVGLPRLLTEVAKARLRVSFVWLATSGVPRFWRCSSSRYDDLAAVGMWDEVKLGFGPRFIVAAAHHSVRALPCPLRRARRMHNSYLCLLTLLVSAIRRPRSRVYTGYVSAYLHHVFTYGRSMGHWLYHASSPHRRQMVRSYRDCNCNDPRGVMVRRRP